LTYFEINSRADQWSALDAFIMLNNLASSWDLFNFDENLGKTDQTIQN
jgi:hypothetical protein